MHRPLRAAVVLAALAPSTARAFDWVELAPGVQYAEDVRSGPTRVYIADIDTCAPGVHFRATSPLDGTSARVTSSFAAAVGGTVTTNGDFFDHDFGLNIGEGVYWGPYVTGWLSDGIDRSTSGNFAVGADRVEMIADTVVVPGPEAWMEQVVSGRWTMIDAGYPYYGIADGGFVCSPGLRQPRTMIGQSADGRHVYMVVGDGRGFGGSVGLTCDEAIDLFLELGAAYAMGMDGGGSSTMVVGTSVMNNPTDGHERAVLNHLSVIADGFGPAPHCGEHAAVPVASAPVGPLVFVGAPGGFTPRSPARAFDTRVSAAGLDGAQLDAEGRVLGDTGFTVSTAALGVAADATAVMVNLVATDPLAPGFVTAHPASQPRPTTSNLNYAAGDTVANAAAIGLDGGGLAEWTLATSHLLADVTGWFGPGGAGLAPLAPERILDTRTSGQRLPAGGTLAVTGALAGGATAISLNIAAVDPAAPGFVTLYPCDEAVPGTSSLNFVAGRTVAGAASIGGGAAGICAFASAETDLVVDVTGAYTPASGLAFSAVAPVRLLDTRQAIGGWSGRVKPGQVITLAPAAIAGFPADGEAVAINVTVTDTTGDGFLTVYPCSGAVPVVSTLNYNAGRTVANFAIADLSDAGELCLMPSASAHLVVDLMGVFAGSVGAATGGVGTFVDPPPGGDGGGGAGGAEVPDGGDDAVSIEPGCDSTGRIGSPWVLVVAGVAAVVGIGVRRRYGP